MKANWLRAQVGSAVPGVVNEQRRCSFWMPCLFASFILTATLDGTAQATTILIDASTRNGSFETGSASPWGGLSVGGFSAVPGWFAILQDTPTGSTARTDGYQFLPISRSNGDTVELSFRAWIDSSGGALDSVSVALSDASFALATKQVVSQPPLTVGYSTFDYLFTLPSTWDSSGNSKLSIQFKNYAATSGQTYRAYLDAVTLQQVPEPSTVVLLLSLVVAGAIPLARRWCDRPTKKMGTPNGL